MTSIPLSSLVADETMSQEGIPSRKAYLSTISDLPPEFLRPTSELRATSLSEAKRYLDLLAADISELQQQKQAVLRKKRKRIERDGLQTEKPLALKQLSTEGFDVEQVWAQARRILEATTAELQQSLPVIAKEDIYPGNNNIETNGSQREQRTVGFRGLDSDGPLRDGTEEDRDDIVAGPTGGEEDSSKIMEEDEAIDAIEDLSDEDDEGLGQFDDDASVADTDGEEGSQEQYVPDRLGLNDGFFSIDDFNKNSEFLEQRDAHGHDDGVASDEEDIDWDVDPLSAQVDAEPAKAPRADEGDGEASDEVEGLTIGNAELNGQDDSDINSNADLEDGHGDLPSIQNTNDILYADFFAPPPRVLTKTTRRRALPKTQPPPSTTTPTAPTEEDMQRAISDVRRDIFEDDLEPHDLSDSDPEAQPRSSHQKRQAELTAEIRRLESEAVAKKPWTLSGEARAGDRPLNSLLEEDLEFERAGKPVPVITQEVSEDIEALIKRRIINREFDEVIRRRPGTLSVGGRGVRRGMMELEDGKPTQSLAEIYEAEHLKNVDPEGYVDKRSEATKKEHEKVEANWKDVCAKLDTLSNLHFRPKPVEASVHVVSDVPTIMMEDARPNAGTDVGESMLAPQELYKAGQDMNKKVEVSTRGGLPVGREEMTREEKVRRRRREKERIKKAGGEVPNAGKSGVVKGKKAEEKTKVVGALKKGGVRVIGRKGEIRDVEGREVKEGGSGGNGVGVYKL